MKNVFLFSLSGFFLISLLSSAFVQPNADTSVAPEGGTSFAMFLSHFEKTEMPFGIQLGDFHKYENQKQVSKQLITKKKIKGGSRSSNKQTQAMMTYIPELKQGLFSRSGPPKVLPIARFYPNDKMIAVVYMTYQSFWEKSLSNYKLALFDLQGKQLSLVAGETDLDYQRGFNLGQTWTSRTQTFSIDEEGRILRNAYKNIWKAPFEKVGMEGNEIIGYELTDTEAFKIDSAGHIEALKDYAVDARASLD